MRVVRVVGLGIALLACAWFVLAARQAHEVDQATAIVSASAPVSTAQAKHAAALLHSAGTLNPDREVDILRAQLDVDQENRAAARAILGRVVADEPENLEAWLELARASVGDVREFFTAAIHVHELAPPATPKR
jgi:hypothetical protein